MNRLSKISSGFGLMLLGAAGLWATPSIQWNVSALPNHQQDGYSTWYQGPQATGYDCNIVKVDVAVYAAGSAPSYSAFSWKGGSGDGTITSDANYAETPASAGYLEIFRAVAVDSAGNSTQPVYWIVKTVAAGTPYPCETNPNGVGYTIGFGDLPLNADGSREFPNLGDAGNNAVLLNDFIDSVAHDSSSKTVEFDPGTYDFDLGSSGQTMGLDAVSNLTLQSSSAGQATLCW